MNPHNRGRRRLYPPWWDHHRPILAPLRRAVERLLASRLRPTPGQTVVDLGCGDRPYEPLFRQYGYRYVGCDLGEGAEVRVEPGRPVGLVDGCADGVVSFQVLEHVWDLDWYLGECRRLLKPGGWLLLSTHGAWLYHPHPTDFRRWTRDGLVQELGQRGLGAEEVRGLVGPLAWTTLFRTLGMREALLRVPALGRLLCVPLVGLMNLRMALEDAVTPAAITDANACIYVVLGRKMAAQPRPDSAPAEDNLTARACGDRPEAGACRPQPKLPARHSVLNGAAGGNGSRAGGLLRAATVGAWRRLAGGGCAPAVGKDARQTHDRQ